MARKNGKSAIAAVLVLAHLVGPLRRPGWRGAVASLDRGKANELRMQVESIAVASGLGEELTFSRSPYPGKIASESGSLEVLSADRHAGHASGFDLVICDESGLFPERSRALVAGLRSSLSARDGRLLHISIRGDGDLFGEVLSNPATATAIYAADAGCALDDRDAWAAANPGLGTIKSLAYMTAEAARAAATPGDQVFFRAHDLNQKLNPEQTTICSPSDWALCETDELPPREGPCYVGWDLGGSTSMTAACALWQNGRLEVWAAFPGDPDLVARGESDGVSGLYVEMETLGGLRTYPGKATPTVPFLQDVAADLEGEDVRRAGADRHRRADGEAALETVGARWPITWRGTGASAVADGSHDVRSFQRRVLAGRLKLRPSLLARHAIRGSQLRFDGAGNPAIDKRRSRDRIDVLSAMVIACGLAAIDGDRPPPRPVRWLIIEE